MCSSLKGGGAGNLNFFFSTKYSIPPSILPLMTWVPQSKLALGQTPYDVVYVVYDVVQDVVKCV